MKRMRAHDDVRCTDERQTATALRTKWNYRTVDLTNIKFRQCKSEFNGVLRGFANPRLADHHGIKVMIGEQNGDTCRLVCSAACV